MRPIAQRGKGTRVLLEVAPGRGRVLDRAAGVIYPVMRLDSILARGYWQPFDGDGDQVIAEARQAREAEDGAQHPRA